MKVLQAPDQGVPLRIRIAVLFGLLLGDVLWLCFSHGPRQHSATRVEKRRAWDREGVTRFCLPPHFYEAQLCYETLARIQRRYGILYVAL